MAEACASSMADSMAGSTSIQVHLERPLKRYGGWMDKPDEQTVTDDIGYKQPLKGTQFRKGVSGNPFGQKHEKRFVEAILAIVLFSVTAPTPECRTHSCPSMEAMI
jgi:hypothetical protein